MEVLQSLIPLVPFLSRALGPNCEIVLHDLTDPKHSILAIANGHISGRKVGGPITDLVLKILKQGLALKEPFITNYEAYNKENHLYRGSSFFIKNKQGEIIGILCVNVDVQQFIDTKQLLESLIYFDKKEESQRLEEPNSTDLVGIFENLNETIDDVFTAIIDKVLNKFSTHPSRFSVEERIQVVKALNESGLFLLKGGLNEAAHRLEVSEPTIYRYLNKIKE